LLSKKSVVLRRSEQDLGFLTTWELNMREQTRPDVVLVGAGIISATLGMLLKQLNSRVTMEILDDVGAAADNVW
jgi:hypothetical protein